MQRALIVALTVAALFAEGTALATPRPLPFTYNYETLGEGELEVEQYLDMVPLKSVTSAYPSGTWVMGTQFQTEFEYGITNHLELGLYMTIAPNPNASVYPEAAPPLTEGTGAKERLRYRFFEEGVLPVDMDLYGELTETDMEFEIEAKLILQKRFGNLRIAANVIGEHEWYFASPQQDWVFDPSAGITYQVTPVFQPGIDSFMWLEHTSATPAPGPANLNLEPNVYVGPAVLLNFGKLWWSTGAYLRVTDFTHTTTVTDSFGPVWFRMIVGLSF
jgi:hypothetical protein